MGTGQSSVSFTNSYGKTISVAYMRRDFSCQAECGDIWDVLGWIVLNPGQTQSRANPTTNRWFYYHAEAVDGAVWAGPFIADVEHQAFEKCTCLGVIVNDGTNPWHSVGFRQLDNAAFGGVNFIP